MSDETFQIPGDVIDKVTAALNAAISITLVHAPSMHMQMMNAAMALDDAVNMDDAGSDLDDE